MKHEESKKQFIEIFNKKHLDFKIIKFTKMSSEIIVEDKNGFRYKKNNCFHVLKNGFNVQSVIDKENFINYKLKEMHPGLTLIKYNGMSERLVVQDENGFKYQPQCYDVLKGSRVSIETCIDKEKLFEFKANKLHNNFYNYPEFKYINGRQKITIKCEIHGEFKQKIESHLLGHGCKKCSSVGFSKDSWLKRLKNKKAFFYIIKVYNDSEEFIKIGITSTSVNKRYQNLIGYKFKIIKLIESTPSVVYDMEKKVLKEYKNFKYLPKQLFEGWSECITINCLNKIKAL